MPTKTDWVTDSKRLNRNVWLVAIAFLLLLAIFSQ